ncbi:phosphonopyruvate decarboxylase [Oribacterium sp. NK2B42]|uniref:phosphonopyruvate decarboxylase n=1 Tax=Oribacterium sp. NK2B42 TaxID=689781 RepID=UPI00040D145A|nr:phosphonopyruvate decarboxylase [Oribacterium sp. NK2B42]
MEAKTFMEILGSEYYTGVPDSLLRPLCDCIMEKYGTDPTHHIIAANEGNAVAIAAGYHLAMGKTAVVYMQNSGEGNIINPLASLLNEKVYGIPAIFVIGWRGEPGVRDEPQHIFQGEITLKLLETMDVSYFVVDQKTPEAELRMKMEEYGGFLNSGRQIAFVIKKNALTNDKKLVYENDKAHTREEAIRTIVKYAGDDPIICTTGKASRELYEIRNQEGMSHDHDFLTVGSMGHASSIALGIALQKPDKRIWCIDGDGAALMHMGAMAVIGNIAPNNFIHIVINNGAHESVGGLPTAMQGIDTCRLAMATGYKNCYKTKDIKSLEDAIKMIMFNRGLSFIEIEANLESRNNLGRPTTSAKDNKDCFMECIER